MTWYARIKFHGVRWQLRTWDECLCLIVSLHSSCASNIAVDISQLVVGEAHHCHQKIPKPLASIREIGQHIPGASYLRQKAFEPW